MSIVSEIERLMVRMGGLALMTMGGVHLAQLPSHFRSEIAFDANKVSVSGTVVQVREETELAGGGGIVSPSKRSEYISTVEFQARNGELGELVSRSICTSKSNCLGKAVRVEYEPSSLDRARLSSDLSVKTRVIARGLFFSVFVALGALCFTYIPKDSLRGD